MPRKKRNGKWWRRVRRAQQETTDRSRMLMFLRDSQWEADSKLEIFSPGSFSEMCQSWHRGVQ